MLYIVFISSKTNEHKYCYGLSKHMQKLQKLNFSRRNGWRCRYLLSLVFALKIAGLETGIDYDDCLVYSIAMTTVTPSQTAFKLNLMRPAQLGFKPLLRELGS